MNIKTTSLLALALLFSGMAFAQKTFRVSGKIVGLKDGSRVSLINAEKETGSSLASTPTRNGAFVLTGAYQRPTVCLLRVSTPNEKKKGAYCSIADIRLILEPTPITVQTTVKALDTDSLNFFKEGATLIKGGKYQTEFNEYKNVLRAQETKAQRASFAEADAWFANNGNEEAIVKEKKTEDLEAARLQEMKNNFVRQHPDFAISAYVAGKNITDLFKYTKEELQGFADCVKGNTDTARVHRIQKILPLAMKYAKGVTYTDFKGLTPEGASKRLSECMQPGTYTLIDFWASWCGPCRSAIGKVKALGEKYKGRLTLVSASVDEKEGDWKKAEQEEKMMWAQLLIPKDELSGVVAKAYDIETIPRLVLINPQGEILLVTFAPAKIGEALSNLIK